MAISKEEIIEEKKKELKRIRNLIARAEANGKFEPYEIEELKSYCKLNPKFYPSVPYCKVCGVITKKLFEEPATTRRMSAGTLCCEDCRHSNYAEIDKGKIIDEVMRRETQKIKFKAEEIAYPKGI